MSKQVIILRYKLVVWFLSLGFVFLLSSCASKASKKNSLNKQQSTSDAVLSSSESTPQDYSFLLGKWQGEVMTNSSDPTGGGKPTLGETGTEVYINLFKNDQGIEGTLDIGQVQEQWQFINEQHIWSDNNIKVYTQELAQQQLPNWIKARIMNYKYSDLAVFKYLSCHKLEDVDQACEVKKDIPAGIIDNGVWVFMIQGENLFVNVYYSYPSGGQRILEQKLSKR
ncbi:MAG TPA: hypothetical protein PKC21_01680 [Oligoflexia bacterium]|nr:hypothetical protein [Oligoflexia bacterium]HMR24042.1 hypothetical protein [Oligoflexia bacterium]